MGSKSLGFVSKLLFGETKRTHLQANLDRAAEAANSGNVDEIYRLLKPWVKPRCKAPLCVKLENGQWTRTPDGSTRHLSRDKLSRVLSWRAEDREPCWGTVPPTVDEVLDLILSASRGEAPGEDGISTVLGAGGRPMAMLLQPLFADVRLQTALSIVWEGSIMATIPSGKNKTRGVMLNDHVGKILGRWIRPNLQIEPPLVALAAGVFVDVARIRGLWAAAVFCDLAAACCSVVRQYVVGTDLPESVYWC